MSHGVFNFKSLKVSGKFENVCAKTGFVQKNNKPLLARLKVFDKFEVTLGKSYVTFICKVSLVFTCNVAGIWGDNNFEKLYGRTNSESNTLVSHIEWKRLLSMTAQTRLQCGFKLISKGTS